MVLFGCDYQLPSISNSGATKIHQLNKSGGMKGLHYMTQCQGGLQFMNLAEEVIEMEHDCHETEDQVIFKDIIERLCLGRINEQDEASLHVLTLDYDHYTSKEINAISDGALHLYTRHQREKIQRKKMR
jgi:hypothetical protein